MALPVEDPLGNGASFLACFGVLRRSTTDLAKTLVAVEQGVGASRPTLELTR